MQTLLESLGKEYYISKDGLSGIVFGESLKNDKYTRRNGLFLKREKDSMLYLKFKYDGNKLYVYNYYFSPENRNMINITKINNTPIDIVIKKIKDIFKNEISFIDIERILYYPNVLKELKIIDDDYCITISNDGKEYNCSLFNVSSELNSGLFYKKHKKNKVIDEFSRIENNNEKNKGNIYKINYAYDSSCNLLKMLSELSIKVEDKEIFSKLYNMLGNISDININEDSNLDWMIISSYFLLNDKSMKNLPKSYYQDNTLCSYYFKNCYYLDKDNNKVGILNSEFYEYEENIDELINSTENNLYKDDNEYYKELKKQGVLTIKRSNLPGCNNYILKNGKLDRFKFFNLIRNSFAHSLYEVIDGDKVRLYGYDKFNELDFNVIVDKEFIKKLINDYEFYSSLNNSFPMLNIDVYSDYVVDLEGIQNKEELKEYLKYIKIINLKSINYKENFNPSNYNTIHYLSKILEISNRNNYLFISDNGSLYELCDSLKNEVDIKLEETKITNEEIDYIVNEIENKWPNFYEHGYSNKNIIISNIFKSKKLDINNLNNAFLKILNTSNKSSFSLIKTLDSSPTEIYDLSNYLKIIIISFLNNVLLYSYNDNININTKELDLATVFNVDREEMKKNILFRIDKLKKGIIKKQTMKQKLEKNYKEKQQRLNNPSFLTNAPLDIIKKEETLFKELHETLKNWDDEKIKLEIDELKDELEMLNNKLIEMDCGEFSINNYIFRHLRNSMAHGNIIFEDNLDITNISDSIICFKDYHPDTGEITFTGKATVKDIIEQFSNELFLKSIYVDNSNLIK